MMRTSSTSLSDAENARLGAKPADTTAASRAGVATRRALGDISNAGAAARPAAAAKPIGFAARTTASGVPVPMAAAAPLPPSVAAAASTLVDRASIASSEVSSMSDLSMLEGMPEDIDALDAADPLCFADYVGQIYQHYKDTEPTRTARFGYMAQQSDINERMRAILIDWLIEVHLKFKLAPETMFLTVNLIDRFLERKVVIRQKLQLVGVTAMLLASKYEEIYAPEVRDFVYITDKAYTREQILAMEAAMLTTLDFRITVPTGYVFLNRFLKVAKADAKLTQLASYFMERTLQEYKLLQHLPSKIAAACVNIACRTLRGRHAWTPTLQHYTGYSEEALRPTIVDLQDVLSAATAHTLQAVRKKYSQARSLEVASIAFTPLDA